MANTKSCKIAGAWMKDDWPPKVKDWLKNNLPHLSVSLDREALEFAAKHGVDRDGSTSGSKLKLFVDLNTYKERDNQPDFQLKVSSDTVAYDAFAAARKTRYEGNGEAQAPAKQAPAEPEDDLPF